MISVRLFISPIIILGFAVDEPLGRKLFVKDVNRLERVRLVEDLVSLTDISSLLVGYGVVAGYKQGSVAVGKQMKPLTVFLPGNLAFDDTDTVCVAHIKDSVLRKSEGQGVDTHIFCSAPLSAACVVTGS